MERRAGALCLWPGAAGPGPETPRLAICAPLRPRCLCYDQRSTLRGGPAGALIASEAGARVSDRKGAGEACDRSGRLALRMSRRPAETGSSE